MLLVGVIYLVCTVATVSQACCGKQFYNHTIEAFTDEVYNMPIDKGNVYLTKAKKHAWPWQAAIFYNQTFVCGASIVSRKHILTAAHCFDNDNSHPERYAIIAGADNVEPVCENDSVGVCGPGHRSQLKRLFIHEGYQANANDRLVGAENDIALAVLERPIRKFNEYGQPVCLPSDSSYIENEDPMTITGYGCEEEESYNRTTDIYTCYQFNYTLQERIVVRRTEQHCARNLRENTLSGLYGSIFNAAKIMCTYYTGSFFGIKEKDDGGPLVAYHEVKKKWFQYGISLWSTPIFDNGGPKRLSLHTKVSAFCAFLKEKSHGDVKCH